MNYYYISFRSVTRGQRALNILERAGITARLLRTPMEISTDGCGYCIKVSERNLAPALEILSGSDLSYSRIFVLNPSGQVRELQ